MNDGVCYNDNNLVYIEINVDCDLWNIFFYFGYKNVL